MLQMYARDEERGVGPRYTYPARMYVQTCTRVPTHEDARTACPVIAECRMQEETVCVLLLVLI